MPNSYMLYPVLIQVALTFLLLGAMGRARVRYLKASRTHPQKVALGENLFPPDVVKIANAFHNQLELPILFYAVSLFAIVLNQADWILFALGLGFAISRVVHAWSHAGSNWVPTRAAIYSFGALFLLLMWVWLAVKVIAR